MRTLTMALAATIVLLLGTGNARASSTGNLKGRITDELTKKGLPSAPVQIEGINLGTISNAGGDYLLMNLPPGTYTVVARSMGKHTVTARGVEIRAGYTTTRDFALADSIQTRPAKEAADSEAVIDIDDGVNGQLVRQRAIASMPVDEIDQLLECITGVVVSPDGTHLWGGRTGETGLILDDMRITDYLGGRGGKGVTMNISTREIQEVQVTKGGAPAEQGNALSGQVQITTKPPADSVTGRIAFFTDNFRTSILNKNSTNFDRVEFSLSGPEPFITSHLLPKLGVGFLKGVKYAVSGALDKSDGYANYKQYFNAVTQRGFRERSLLGLFDLTDRMNNAYEAALKLDWHSGKGVKLAFNYRGSWDDYTQFQWDYRYTPATAPVVHQQARAYSLRLTHQLNPTTCYEIMLSQFRRDYLEMPGDPDHPGFGLTPGQFLLLDQYEYYYDRNGNRRFDPPEPCVNANGDVVGYSDQPSCSFGDQFIPQPNVSVGRFPGYGSEWDGVDWRFVGQGNSTELVDTILTDWNGNGVIDFYESEAFVDLNGDGRWNIGDYLIHDTNGNGVYDQDRAAVTNIDAAEPYVDGDIVLGEPFIDANLNGFYDPGIDIFVVSPEPNRNMDINRNSVYDGPNTKWSLGIPYRDLNGNGLYDAPNGAYDYGESFLDLNGNGKWDARDGFYDAGHQQWAFYQNRSASRTTLDFKINRLFGRNTHDVKSGLTIDLHTLRMADLRYPNYEYDGLPDGGNWPERGILRDFYTRRPITGAFFVQDKMEYGAMIANIGLRYDFFVQSSDIKNKLTAGEVSGKSVAGSRNRFSPRVGFSYPISTGSRAYFNYGYYCQLPDLNLMYHRATQASNAFRTAGDENLDFEKTVQYSVGLTCRLSGSLSLDVSGYFKDMYGIINSIREGSDTAACNIFRNSDYARARGFEVKLNRQYGDFISGYASYAYAFAYGKSSNENSNYFDDFYSRAIPIRESPLDWDVRHQLTVNLDLNVPRGTNPSLFGLRLPQDWGVNLLWQFASGKPFTPDKDYPGLRLLPGESPQTNSMRYPTTSNIDVRFFKRFPFLGLSYSAELWVSNLFDTKNVQRVYESTGRYDTTSKLTGANYVLQGSDLAHNPLNLGPGRNVRIGLCVEF